DLRGCASAGKSKMLARCPLAHFPDEAVVIKMEQSRSRHQTGKKTFDDVDLRILEITERAVGKNQTNIETGERAAAAKDKPHKPADGTILFDAIAIVNPDEREV